MATLIITLGDGTGPDVDLPFDLDDDTAARQANQIRKLKHAWRYPEYTVRDAAGGEVVRFDVRKFKNVSVSPSLGTLSTPGCGKSAAANDESIR